MYKLKHVQYMIHSRSYSFLFTLTIAFIAIFEYNSKFYIHITINASIKQWRDFQPQHLQKQKKHCKITHKQPLTYQR